MWLSLLLVPALSALLVQCATVVTVRSDCGNVQVLSNELTAREAEEYCRYAVSERQKVEAFWGATWKDTIYIHVDSSYQLSRALIPAYQGNRGFMEMPLKAVREKRGALLHEIVHIYALNANRFLAEGLAVYFQDKMGGNPAFPNFGEDLRILARQRISGITSLAYLNQLRTLGSGGVGSTRRLGRTDYILAGSFVGFLIENYGLANFRKLYDTEDYGKGYGKSLAALESEWRLYLASQP